MTTTCIINDFTIDFKTIVLFETGDFNIIHSAWMKEDKILVGLQNTSIFAGKTRWDDLDPTHWRILIIRNMMMAAALPENQRIKTNPIIRSLYFLLCGLIVCLEKRCESNIEVFRVNRVSEFKVSYDYSASLNMAIGNKTPINFKVVVDNT